MNKTKKWACLLGMEGLSAFEGGVVGGLIKEYKYYPDQIERIKMFLEDNPDKLQYVFEQTGTSHIQDAATLLYGERLSTFCGLFSKLCRDIDLPLEFASISPSAAVLGAGVMAGFLCFKHRQWEKQKANIQQKEEQPKENETIFEKKM